MPTEKNPFDKIPGIEQEETITEENITEESLPPKRAGNPPLVTLT